MRVRVRVRTPAGAASPSRSRGVVVPTPSLRTHALPLAGLAVVVGLDLGVGRDQSLIGLVVLVPMIAATVLGLRATAAYGIVALAAAALLGVYDLQYADDTRNGQLARLVLVSVGGLVALFACALRCRREDQVVRMAAQQAADRAVLQLGETLQRSLLTEPPQLAHLDTAVRYRPATRGAQVGGDWFDAFTTPGGSTMFVIGDVAGHDAPAAAQMAQARGMLRGLAHAVTGSPAAVLRSLDRAIVDLEMDTLVTVTVATADRRGGTDGLVLRWSNAGHPPPVLVTAGGTASLLERAPDLLLGVGPDAHRADHEVPLAPGDTLLFYTDGLVERRDASLDDGLAALVERLDRSAGRPLAEVCDDLLTAFGEGNDDDIALLAVRVQA